ncbi:MAG: hypothetical protein IKV16_04605 [Clostridia bacterium]|nr:hypothetical protein [Clostridia bacterium]
MFGYVKPVHSELLVKEHEFYKATYCGICRAMKKHTGFFSNVALTYDSVFLALVRMLYVPDSDIGAERHRCVAHPLKKKGMLRENEALIYTARAFAILTYHKTLDDIRDEKFVKKTLVKTARPIFKKGSKKARLDILSRLCKEKLDAINELEAKGEESVDNPASLFGELLGEIFAYGFSGSDRLVLYSAGYHLGRFIYAADAAEDYDDDRVSGKYNPYVKAYGGQPLTPENKQTIKCALILECKKIEGAVNLFPFGERRVIENIIKNIIYLGLIKRIDFLDTPENKDEDKKEIEQ